MCIVSAQYINRYMSIISLSKSVSYSQSPALRKQKIVPIQRVSQIIIEDIPSSLNKLINADSLIKDKFKSLPKNVSRMNKIAMKQKYCKSGAESLSNSAIFSLNSVVDTDNLLHTKKNIKIEGYLLEKLKNETNYEKKFDIVVSTAEKLCDIDRNFYIFYKVIKQFFIEYKEYLIKQNDRIFGFQDLEKSHKSLKNSYDKLAEQCSLIANENRSLQHEVEKLREDNGQMKNKIKRNGAFLKSLQLKGIPVEEMYKEQYGSQGSTAKSLNQKSLHGVSSNEERPPSHQITVIPKLTFPVNVSEGYQEEFMAKFKEFSESWRNQIINDHYCNETDH